MLIETSQEQRFNWGDKKCFPRKAYKTTRDAGKVLKYKLTIIGEERSKITIGDPPRPRQLLAP